MADVVNLARERALRELAELCEDRPDIATAVAEAASMEGETMADELDFLTVVEAAALLRLQPVTIRAWIRLGKVPAYHAGRRVLLRRADVVGLVQPLRPGELVDLDDDDAAPDAGQ